MIHEAIDLSPRAAAEKSAASGADYHGLCWQNTFSDVKEDAYPFWAGQTDAHKVSAIRSAIVTIYSYLHFRSKHDNAIEDERVLFLEEIEPEWRPILARALRISVTEMERRQPRRAFGHDLSIPQNDLFALANDQEIGASLLLEGYRREEVRRLEFKAHCLKNGPLSEREIQSDEFWARKNRETFEIAESKIAIAQEARQAVDATSPLASFMTRSALVDVPAVEPVAWREIEGYQGLYEVSSGGDVRSIQTGRLLAKNLAGSGYVKADLWKNGKRWQTTVHRLVADAFLEKQGSEINHINGIKTDNRVENLEWCSRSENVSHSFYVLSKRVRPVEAYNPGTGEKRHYRSVCEAARDGFKSSQIYRALKNHNRTVKGFHWQEASPPLSREGEDSAEVERLTRPIVGIEYRTAQEVFDIMADRIRLAATRSGSATSSNGGEHG